MLVTTSICLPPQPTRLLICCRCGCCLPPVNPQLQLDTAHAYQHQALPTCASLPVDCLVATPWPLLRLLHLQIALLSSAITLLRQANSLALHQELSSVMTGREKSPSGGWQGAGRLDLRCPPCYQVLPSHFTADVAAAHAQAKTPCTPCGPSVPPTIPQNYLPPPGRPPRLAPLSSARK